MSERINWFLENRIIWLRPQSITTREDLVEDNEVLTQMIRQAFAITEMPVHVIIDGKFMGTQPSPLEGRRLLTYVNEPGMGYRIVAGVGNPNHYFFSKFVGTLNPGSTLIFPTILQALSTLARKDKTLPDLIALYHLQRNTSDNQ